MKKFIESELDKVWRCDKDGKLWDELFASSQASDFYFYAETDRDSFLGNATNIYISPVDYFDESNEGKNHAIMLDQHINLEHLLPSDEFEVLMESTWGSEKNILEVKEYLLSKGFIENNKLRYHENNNF